MYHAESLNTGFRTAGAGFTDESLRTRISLRLRVVPFLRGGGFRGGFTPPCKVLYCTVTLGKSETYKETILYSYSHSLPV